MKNNIIFKVNGKNCQVNCYPWERLLDVLRGQELGLTGAKEGCGEGECGACSVLVDGELVNSCLVPMGQMQAAEIETIEGMGTEEQLTPLQKAFLEHNAAQCGICTPGMIIAAQALLKINPHPTHQEIRQGLAGNLCRCTGHQKIIEAVAAVSSGGKIK